MAGHLDTKTIINATRIQYNGMPLFVSSPLQIHIRFAPVSHKPYTNKTGPGISMAGKIRFSVCLFVHGCWNDHGVRMMMPVIIRRTGRIQNCRYRFCFCSVGWEAPLFHRSARSVRAPTRANGIFWMRHFLLSAWATPCTLLGFSNHNFSREHYRHVACSLLLRILLFWNIYFLHDNHLFGKGWKLSLKHN